MTNIWDIYAGLYDLLMEKSQKDDKLFSYIKKYLNKSDIIYDGACGTGIFSVELASHVKQIYACDLSEKMIQQTDKKIKKYSINNIHTQIGDVTDIGFEDNTFDAAIVPNVIHLVDNPEKVLNELKRVVKRGGYIIIPTYITKVNNRYLQNIGKTIFALVGFKPNSWTEEEYLRILKENNMNIIDYRTFKLKQYECTVIIKNE